VRAIEAVVLAPVALCSPLCGGTLGDLGEEHVHPHEPVARVRPKAVVEDEVLIVVQVNGKVRDRITVPGLPGRRRGEVRGPRQ